MLILFYEEPHSPRENIQVPSMVDPRFPEGAGANPTVWGRGKVRHGDFS